MINLLDDDSDEESQVDSPKDFPKGGNAGDDDEKADEEMVDPEEDTHFIAVQDTGIAGVSEEPRASPPSYKGEESQEVHETTVAPTLEGSDKFSELGTSLIPRRLSFQGLDVDPYLWYAIEVDVVNMVLVLGELLELGPAGAGTSAHGGLGAQSPLPEDVESFDSEGECIILKSSGPL